MDFGDNHRLIYRFFDHDFYCENDSLILNANEHLNEIYVFLVLNRHHLKCLLQYHGKQPFFDKRHDDLTIFFDVLSVLVVYLNQLDMKLSKYLLF